MKQLLLICAVVALVGCGEKKSPEPKAKPKAGIKKSDSAPVITVTIDNSIIEEAIRYELQKPMGELTMADLKKVTKLIISGGKLADVKDLEKLPALKELVLDDNKLTKLPTGLEKLPKLEDLDLSVCKLTEVKGLEKLTQLKYLWITRYPSVTKSQIDKLKKALPKCLVHGYPTK